ncbi:SdpI family protein [Bacillus multifaciens]|uniref:SdpI family protein n=1 Tax=Bacillus multifaciens TaxID=3068506 RepID=UPI0027421FF2|nr:SdpI family protein [Bacillus sp. WLY-B-L8]MDP7980866.1 SdpI family protein [Bacillus sp. WLY-B-L8]HDX9588058.1 SdpI family protein [Bacillus pseudomycoides]
MVYMLVNIGISLLIGIIFILSALLLKKYPPSDINAAFGYRTRRSMKNIELWHAGNKYSAEIMRQNGFFMMLIGSIISLTFRYPHTIIALIALMILLIIIMFLRVETKLKVMEK